MVVVCLMKQSTEVALRGMLKRASQKNKSPGFSRGTRIFFQEHREEGHSHPRRVQDIENM